MDTENKPIETQTEAANAVAAENPVAFDASVAEPIPTSKQQYDVRIPDINSNGAIIGYKNAQVEATSIEEAVDLAKNQLTAKE